MKFSMLLVPVLCAGIPPASPADAKGVNQVSQRVDDGHCVRAAMMTLESAAVDSTVELRTDDLLLLHRLLRSSGSTSPTEQELENRYFLHGSPGLRAYASRHGLTAAKLAEAIERHPNSYSDLKRLFETLSTLQPQFDTAFARLRELYPNAVAAPVWFIAGARGPGGMADQVGVIISAERFTDRPHEVVPLALHELTHVQMAVLQGVERYRRIYTGGGTLLDLALREGIAELVAELTTGRHINPKAERYGIPRERALWEEFRLDMHNTDPGEWMFVQPSDGARPADLGYWIGYRIARTYYERATDKRAAIRELLAADDYKQILERSGYLGVS